MIDGSLARTKLVTLSSSDDGTAQQCILGNHITSQLPGCTHLPWRSANRSDQGTFTAISEYCDEVTDLLRLASP
jgi:hypothetical protein